MLLLQRIILSARDSRGVVCCRGLWSPSFRKGEVCQARSTQQPREGIVSFVAARLVIDSVFLVALPGELLLHGPWTRPHGRIFDRDRVFERGRPGPHPALDQVQ